MLSPFRLVRHDWGPRARARGPPDAHLVFAEVAAGPFPRNAEARAQVGSVDGRPISRRGGGELQLGWLINFFLLLAAATAASLATRGPNGFPLLTR